MSYQFPFYSFFVVILIIRLRAAGIVDRGEATTKYLLSPPSHFRGGIHLRWADMNPPLTQNSCSLIGLTVLSGNPLTEKNHLDPFRPLATINQPYTQTHTHVG